jgi:hypothetical protein
MWNFNQLESDPDARLSGVAGAWLCDLFRVSSQTLRNFGL